MLLLGGDGAAACAEKQKAEGEGFATAYSTVRLSPLSSELWRL